MLIIKKSAIKGNISVPSDKSISHRAIMCGALACDRSKIYNLLMSEDVISTIGIVNKLGATVTIEDGTATVDGVGLKGFKSTESLLYAGNSGTTARIMSGILAGQDGRFVLDGDKYLRTRPMERVIKPLSLMGAKFANNFLPMRINGGNLQGIDYEMEVKSAQVKSAIIFAGLNAKNKTTITEKGTTRNHTESMLANLSANITVSGNKITILPTDRIDGFCAEVPGDISSAGFFMVLGLIIKDSEITIKKVGINPTRSGIIDIIKAMGGEIEVNNVNDDLEPTADITVRYTENLTGTVIEGDIVSNIIDEIPIISVLACFAKGKTVIKDAQELRVKETDRINAMVTNLTAMGAKVAELPDGMEIEGGKLRSAVVDSFGDHRIAMSCAIALSAVGGEITDDECVKISFPNFYQLLRNI